MSKVGKESALSDEELVASLQERMDAERFGVLYDRYAERVFQKCIALTRDRDLAKDLTHDIFLKVFTSLKQFDHRAKFGTWLYRVTHNYCLDHLRKQQRHKEVELEDGMAGRLVEDDPNELRLMGMRADRLDQVLAAIDPTDRALLLMKYQDGLSVKEIQEVLEVGESAVKMRMMRARERAMSCYHELFQEGA
ncbi:MAG: RNA polymerase sigma factor [Flavobacteriales bacterium]|nr:RNA polymerase sigma factor [Flavobacteriales bacterium]